MENSLFKLDILDSLVSAILVTDADLKLLYMNPSAEEMLGMSFSRVQNRSIYTLISSPQLEANINHAMATGQSHVYRAGKITVHADHNINVDYIVSTLTDDHKLDSQLDSKLDNLADNPVKGMLFELTQVDRQLKIARETHLLNTQSTNQSVLRGIAHEIKNPLGGLRGAAQLLEVEFADDAIKEYTQIIISEADRLTKLVDNMLGSSQPSQKTQVNIHEVLEHASQVIKSTIPHSISIETDYDPSIPEIAGDRDQLVQVMLNIINNAVKSLDGEGIIQLKSRITRNFTIRQHSYPLVVKVQIIDNGKGIPDELQETIFFPMITGYADGTGLGLSIAQSLMNQHNGLIEFESKPGNTVFSIIIPVSSDNSR